MKQCMNHHFYDERKYEKCPYCSGNGAIGVTRPLLDDQATGAFTGGAAGGVIPPTMPLKNNIEQTMPLYETDAGIAPVCGWLICINGAKKGMDFRLHSDRNSIGRDKSNDVCIGFDEAVSMKRHVTITYDSRTNQFFLQQGESTNNVYINGKLLLNPVELKSYDRITLGNTDLVFTAFCNDNFQWEK